MIWKTDDLHIAILVTRTWTPTISNIFFFLLRRTIDIASVWMRYILLYPLSMLLQSWTRKYMHILLFKPSLSFTRTYERGSAIIFLPWDQISTTRAQKRMNGPLKLHSFKSNGLSSSWKEKISCGGPKEGCQKDPSRFYGLGCFRISCTREFQP